MPHDFDFGVLTVYLEVIMINIVLSGDNVVVIGMAAAGLSPELRNKAILAGIAAAAVIRIVFAVVASQLLGIVGVQLAGGLLLLWVCWTMFRDLWWPEKDEAHAGEANVDADGGASRFRRALGQIILADVSMSLDNVLAVAAAAKQNVTALVFGLALSVILMGVASTFVASLISRYRWIAWIGLIIIVYVAGEMIFEGTEQLIGYFSGHAA